MDPLLIERARQQIERATRPVVFTVAGVSADSGVPTFRGAAEDALWGRYDPRQLASPQGFAANPKLVYDWYTWRRQRLADVLPNGAHDAIAHLQARTGAVVITQNVDGLHERVAPPDGVVLRLHGTIADDRCSACDHREAVDFHTAPALRLCNRCGDGTYLRPAVVWFGEGLDPDTWATAERAARAADVMLVVGTSGEVYPAAGLVSLAAGAGAAVIVVNADPGPLDDLADIALHGRAAEIVPRIVR